MRFLIFTFLSALALQQVVGQQIRGSLRDESTGDPIAFATVYLANTSTGDITDPEGNFLMENVPTGKYDLVVSYVGYQRLMLAVEIQKRSDTTLHLYMRPDLVTLREVKVVADSMDRVKYMPVFLESFLGANKTSKSCEIVNLNKVYLYYDKAERKLYAHAKEPIEVHNEDLGWTLYNDLVEFQLDFGENKLYNFGIYRYEFDSTLTRKNLNKRDETYESSMLRFFHYAFDQNQLLDSYDMLRAELPDDQGSDLVYQTLSEDNLSVYLDCNESICMLSPGTYRIVIKDVFEDRDFLTHVGKSNRSRPESYLYVYQPLKIFMNGHAEDMRNTMVQGYWSWYEKISHALPLGYRPVDR